MKCKTRIRRGFLAVLATAFCLAGAAHAAPHPLDPLTAEELATIKSVLLKSGRFSPNTNFAWIELQEPPKRLVEAFKPGADFPRKAILDAIDYDRKKAFEVVIDVKAKKISSVTDLGDRQPGINDRDVDLARAIIDDDPRIKAALERRGLDVPVKVSDSVNLQFAAIGYDSKLQREHDRLIRVLFASDQKAINEFSPFIEGLTAVVDLYTGKVIQFTDDERVPRFKIPHDFFRPSVRGPQEHANAVLPVQHRGRNVTVAGNTVTWQNWRFRFGFNLREGLVLYQIGFADNGKMRPIAYRAALSEVVTAYADASNFWSWMEIFDEGVFGLGYVSLDVKRGREVPLNALTFSPVLPDPTKPQFSDRFDRRIYLYERDGGNLIDYRQGDLSFHARATELVIGFMASLGNYVYGFNWVFKQDGSFAFEAELAGEIVTKFVRSENCEACKAIAAGVGPNGESRTYSSAGDVRFGTLVYPNLVGLNHQHWFNLRIDFDIDGTGNAVVENNVAFHSAPSNEAAAKSRYFSVTHTVFGKAADAARDIDDRTARSWTIYNPSSLAASGRMAGYTIVPGDNTASAFPASRAKEPVGFTLHPIWVTPYRARQLYAGGAYPNQAKDDDADTLYHYANDASIYDTDIVVWYSFGMTHVPRLEDYPVMPDERLSVTFRPDGFFKRNPALGLGRVSKH